MAMRSLFSGQEPAKPETNEGRRSPAPTPLGLTGAERAELEWYFNGYEADIGIRSTFREMVDAVAESRDAEETNGPVPRGRSSGGTPAYHDRLLGLHFKSDRPLARAARVYRALKATGGLHVTVLWLLHGPTRPNAPHAIFGDIAPIVHLTSAVEDVRKQMALDDGEARYERVSSEYAEALDEQRERIANDFWDAAGEWQRLESRLEHRNGNPRMANEKGARITDELDRRADAWWSVMRTLLRAYRYDGAASATTTAVKSADLEATSQGALRWALEYRGPRGKDGKPDPVAHKVHAAARRAFELRAGLEAHQMRIAAAIAYRNELKAVRA